MPKLLILSLFKEVLEMAAMRKHRDPQDTRPNERVSKLQTDRQTHKSPRTKTGKTGENKQKRNKKKERERGGGNWLQKQ